MKFTLRNIFAVIFLILYIYSIKFTFLTLTGKVLMGIVGIPLFILSGERPRKNDITTVFILSILLIWGYVTTFLNGTNEYLYNTFFLSFFSSFFAAYFIIWLIKKKVFTLEFFLFLIVLACCVESLITALMRFSPGLQSFIFAIQEFQMKNATDQDMLNSFRLMGLGEAVYFGVLPMAALGLSSCCYIFINTQSRRRKIVAVLSYIIIAMVAFLTARYTITIIAITLFVSYWRLSSKISIWNRIKYIIIVTLSIFVLVYALISILPDFIFEWAFSPFLKNAESSTAKEMKDWWTTTTFDISTFIFGDGQYNLGDHYYMETDIGYFRQIYYGGIIGLGLFVALHYNILKNCHKRYKDTNFKCFLTMLFLSWLIMLTKGSKDMLDQYLLILVAVDYLSVTQSNKKCVNL